MKFGKKKLLTTVSAVALVLAVGACSSGNDDGLTAERDTALRRRRWRLRKAPEMQHKPGVGRA